MNRHKSATAGMYAALKNSYLLPVLIMPVAISLGGVGVRRLCGWITDRFILGEDAAAAIGILVAAALIIWACGVYKEHVWYKYEYALYSNQYRNMVSKALHARQSALDGYKLGEVNSIFINDINNLQRFADRLFQNAIPGIMGGILSIALFLQIHWILALTAIVFSIIPMLVIKYLSPYMGKAYGEYRKRLANANAIFSEHLYSLEFVKTNVLEDKYLEAEEGVLNELQKACEKRSVTVGIFSIPMTASAFITTLAIALAGGVMAIRNYITIGELMSAIILADSIVSPVMALSRTWTMYKQAQTSLFAIDTYCALPEERLGGGERAGIAKVSLDNVTFGYTDSDTVLNELSLSFTPGRLNVILGGNGIGKSTLIKLLTGVYDPRGGDIRLGGLSVGDWKLAKLRNSIAVACQDPVTFEGTIEKNLNYGNPALVRKYTKLLGLDAEIMKLEQGYDTMLAWDGKPLSRGQRQRIQLVRTLALDRSVYFLDEPTSAIDVNKADKLSGILHDMARTKIVIVITHETGIIRAGDNVFTLTGRGA